MAVEYATRAHASDAAQGPFRDDVLGAQRLDDRALTLAAQFRITTRVRATSVLPRLDDNARALASAYHLLAGDVRAGRYITTASEWLLDNFHLVTSQIADVRRNLPRTYARQLPPLAARDHFGRARVYAMAVELVRHSDSRLDRSQLEVFLNSYQRVAPLTIGELWAWPSMLTLVLIENLRRLSREILATRAARQVADDHLRRADTGRPAAWPAVMHVASVVQLLLRTREEGQDHPALRREVEVDLDRRQLTADEAVRAEHQRQGVTQVSVANAITSLRLCSEIDWREYLRERQSGRTHPPARSRGRLRPHGFSQSRPAAPGR